MKWFSDFETHVHQPRVLQDLEAGRARGVRGTPGSCLNARYIDTSYGLHHLRDAVRDRLVRVTGRVNFSFRRKHPFRQQKPPKSKIAQVPGPC